jgi:hypothetical protein
MKNNITLLVVMALLGMASSHKLSNHPPPSALSHHSLPKDLKFIQLNKWTDMDSAIQNAEDSIILGGNEL